MSASTALLSRYPPLAHRCTPFKNENYSRYLRGRDRFIPVPRMCLSLNRLTQSLSLSLSLCVNPRTHYVRTLLTRAFGSMPIFSFSAGAHRRFIFRTENLWVDKTTVVLGPGDLLVMGGTTQKTHVHEVPIPDDNDAEKFWGDRINWTVRAFEKEMPST